MYDRNHITITLQFMFYIILNSTSYYMICGIHVGYTITYIAYYNYHIYKGHTQLISKHNTYTYIHDRMSSYSEREESNSVLRDENLTRYQLH